MERASARGARCSAPSRHTCSAMSITQGRCWPALATGGSEPQWPEVRSSPCPTWSGSPRTGSEGSPWSRTPTTWSTGRRRPSLGGHGRGSGSDTCSSPTGRRASRRCRRSRPRPIRREEQIASCREVGVTDVEFLGLPDGGLVEGSSSGPSWRGRSAGTDRTWSCRSTTATRGAGRAGTTLTIGRSVGPCSTPSATPPTPGSSAIAATRGMASASPRSTPARRRPTVSTRRRRSMPVSGRSRATAPTSRTSAATWPRRTRGSAGRPSPPASSSAWTLAATFELIG